MRSIGLALWLLSFIAGAADATPQLRFKVVYFDSAGLATSADRMAWTPQRSLTAMVLKVGDTGSGSGV